MLTIKFKGIIKYEDEQFFAEDQNENIIDDDALDGLDQILFNFGYSPTSIGEEVEITIKSNRDDTRTINERITSSI